MGAGCDGRTGSFFFARLIPFCIRIRHAESVYARLVAKRGTRSNDSNLSGQSAASWKVWTSGPSLDCCVSSEYTEKVSSPSSETSRMRRRMCQRENRFGRLGPDASVLASPGFRCSKISRQLRPRFLDPAEHAQAKDGIAAHG